MGAGCAPQAPVEPFEPLTEDDIVLPPLDDGPRAGEVIEIPLERELDPDREPPTVVEEVPPIAPWKYEAGVERSRGTFRMLGGAGYTVRQCQQACSEAAQCRAFTFKRPREAGGGAICDLKFRVGDPVPCARCTSASKP